MGKKVVKIAGLVLAVTLATSVFTACSSKNDVNTPNGTQAPKTELSGKKVDLKGTTVTFWNGFTASDGDILRDIYSTFNETNEMGIEVKMDIMPWGNMLEKLAPAIATGTAPTMILLGSDSIPEYAKTGGLIEVNEFWAVSGLNQSDYAQNVQDAFKFEGKTFGIPMQYNTMYLYWNKDLFKKAGLDPEKPPKNFTELKSYAAKLTDSANKQYGFGIAKEGSNITNFLWSNGGDWLDQDLKKAACNSKETIEVLSMLQGFAKAGQTPVGMSGADMDNLLFAGQVAMYINGPWLINGCRTNGLNFGIGAVPAADNGKLQVPGGGCAYMVTSSAKEKEKLAAYECIKYWLSKDVLKEWTIKNGFPAWSKDVLADAEVQSDEIQKVLGPLTQYGRLPFPAMPEAGQIANDYLNPLFEMLMYDKISPEDCAKQLADGINKVLSP